MTKSCSFASIKQNLDGFICFSHSNNQIVGNQQEDPQQQQEEAVVEEEYVQILSVPQDWLNPSKALEVPLLIYSFIFTHTRTHTCMYDTLWYMLVMVID